MPLFLTPENNDSHIWSSSVDSSSEPGSDWEWQSNSNSSLSVSSNGIPSELGGGSEHGGEDDDDDASNASGNWTGSGSDSYNGGRSTVLFSFHQVKGATQCSEDNPLQVHYSHSLYSRIIPTDTGLSSVAHDPVSELNADAFKTRMNNQCKSISLRLSPGGYGLRRDPFTALQEISRHLEAIWSSSCTEMVGKAHEDDPNGRTYDVDIEPDYEQYCNTWHALPASERGHPPVDRNVYLAFLRERYQPNGEHAAQEH